VDLEPLLGAADPAVFRIIRSSGGSDVLLTADHAGCAIPCRLAGLHLSVRVLDTHLALDLGVAGLGECLSARLDAFLILHNYSRLVIDVNRPPEAPDSIVSHSEFTPIPANGNLSPAERQQRVEALFHHYHQRIGAELDARSQRGQPSVLVALHSFTPVHSGQERPWHVGVLHGRDGRLARRMRRGLRREPGLQVGNNEPYAVSDASDCTLVIHGERRRIPHVELEIRQNLLATPSGQQEWAERLAGVLEAALREHFPLLQDGPASAGCRMDQPKTATPQPTPQPTAPLQIRVGFDVALRFPEATPMIVTLDVHSSRAGDLLEIEPLQLTPALPLRTDVDSYGNRCSRLVAQAGRLQLRGGALVADDGLPDPVLPSLVQQPVQDLPEEALLFLLASRFCESDLLSDVAWSRFEAAPKGWGRVQAICDFVHQYVRFDYGRTNPTKSALQTFESREGVCRDFAHLAIALCRCMNIPARYCMGYLSDIGVPPPHTAMDFAGWFEAYLGDGWHVFDPRNNTPRIGRILIARGRDAADVALTTTFGPSLLESFEVRTA